MKISKKTLKTMDKSVENLKKGKVSNVIDLGHVDLAQSLSIKRTTEMEEFYEIGLCSISAEKLENGLKSGNFCLTKSLTIPAMHYIVDASGKRIAILSHTSSCGPDEIVEIKTR